VAGHHATTGAGPSNGVRWFEAKDDGVSVLGHDSDLRLVEAAAETQL
jgi:hypothetical protein